MILTRISFFALLCLLANQTAIEAMDGEMNARKQAHINECLIAYASRNSMDGVVKCLQFGAQVNAQNSVGQTALHCVLVGNYQWISEFYRDPRCIPSDSKDYLVAFLIEQKADVNLVDKSLQTPMHYAALYDRIHALELLKNAGGNLNAQNNVGSTPCHRAADNHSVEAIAWLAEAGADMNWVDSTGMAPLHTAVYWDWLFTTVHLLKQGARLDIRTEKNVIEDAPESTLIPAGSTVFHLAAIPNKNSAAMQRQLLYHALWHPEGREIGKKEFITFLCCLQKGLPAIYGVRNTILEPLMPYLVGSLSRKLIVGFLARNNKFACSAAHNMLMQRMLVLKTVVAAENENGDTAYQLECRAKVQNRDNNPQTLLLADLYDEQLKKFVEAARSHTIVDLPSDNILKAPYENAPAAQSTFSWLQTKAQECIIS